MPARLHASPDTPPPSHPMTDSTTIRKRAALTTSEGFELEPIKTSTGRWTARLWYSTQQGRRRHRICSVTLREPERGGIVFDLGSREKGGRLRLGTRDPQEAIQEAEKRLARIGSALVAGGAVQTMMEYAGGDLTIPQLAAVFFAEKGPHRENGIGQHHADNMARMFDVMTELNGHDWTVSQADQEWIHRMIEERMKGVTFSRVKERSPLGHVEWNTARDSVGYFMGAVLVATNTPDPNRPGRTMQDLDPFARAGVELPKGRAPAQKPSVGTEHYLRLMLPVARDGHILPAPVDRADETGATRLMQAAFFHLGVRRGQLLVAKRGHLALTPREVQVMIAQHGHSIRNQDWRYFVEHGLWLFDGDQNKMAHVDKEGYTRVMPISADLREEIDLYFERNPDIAGDRPDAPLLRAPSNATMPLSNSAAYGTPDWVWVLDSAGEPITDAHGKHIHAVDENGRWKIRRHRGRFYRALEIARDDIIAEGRDWSELYPYESGSLVHVWRGHLEILFEALGYIREVAVEGGGSINLTRHADYLLMRKMEDSVRFEHYIPLDPTILLGMVAMREAEEVLAERGVRRADEIDEARIRLRTARETLRAARVAA